MEYLTIKELILASKGQLVSKSNEEILVNPGILNRFTGCGGKLNGQKTGDGGGGALLPLSFLDGFS